VGGRATYILEHSSSCWELAAGGRLSEGPGEANHAHAIVSGTADHDSNYKGRVIGDIGPDWFRLWVPVAATAGATRLSGGGANCGMSDKDKSRGARILDGRTAEQGAHAGNEGVGVPGCGWRRFSLVVWRIAIPVSF
jgi:hypothetical protein